METVTSSGGTTIAFDQLGDAPPVGSGGRADPLHRRAPETVQVDALDEQAVDEYLDAAADKAGGIDVSFNLIS